MPIITNLETCKKNKNRVNIYIDDVFFKAAFAEVVIKNKLKTGDEINEEKLEKLLSEEEVAAASVKAVNYLSRFYKTKKEVHTYLIKKGFSENTCEIVLNKLIDYGYISDKQFAKSYKESKENYAGPKLIKLKLMQKGISKDEVEKLNFSSEKTEQAAMKLADKYLKNKEKTKENVFKMQNYLLSKGFSYEETGTAVKKYLNGEYENESWD